MAMSCGREQQDTCGVIFTWNTKYSSGVTEMDVVIQFILDIEGITVISDREDKS
jgi:hypothetical protein